ncbi:MAG: ATP12 chaperone family protein [Alphaproteobacteria bacterium]|nr:ATP12 chaperone family protein [Alphaproteobacteria bacterium]
MKRFYKLVTISEEADGFSIVLDGKPVKTSLRNKLSAPNKALALAVMQEWAAQEDTIKPETMGLTQILTTAIDNVSAEIGSYQRAVLRYIDTDFLCYQAAEPVALVERQQKIWGGWRSVMAELVGAQLETTDTLKALEQDGAYHKWLTDYVTALEVMRLTVLQLVVSLSGSAILGVLLLEQKITADEIYGALMVEDNFKAEIYDEEKYGAAPFQEKARASLRGDLEASERFLFLLEE